MTNTFGKVERKKLISKVTNSKEKKRDSNKMGSFFRSAAD